MRESTPANITTQISRTCEPTPQGSFLRSVKVASKTIMAPSELVPALKDEVGTALRSVGRYNGQEHEVEFLREDVDAIYDPDEIDAVFDDLALQGMSSDHLESLFNAGELHCAMFRFDDALMFHFPHADFSGLFVTIDTGAGVDVESFVETCKEHT